jgi:hypothetical protein
MNITVTSPVNSIKKAFMLEYSLFRVSLITIFILYCFCISNLSLLYSKMLFLVFKIIVLYIFLKLVIYTIVIILFSTNPRIMYLKKDLFIILEKHIKHTNTIDKFNTAV